MSQMGSHRCYGLGILFAFVSAWVVAFGAGSTSLPSGHWMVR